MDIGETLYVTTSKEWRAWLQEHHRSAPDIWLVYYGKQSGKPRISYNESVEEALCFGWIDSIVKKLDADGRAQRFTPRRQNSPISPMNAERMRRLIEQKRMTQAGLDAVGDALDQPFAIPADILASLQEDPEVWRHFDAFPESYKRIRIGWIDGARRRPDVLETRLRYFLKMTRQDKRFGMVQ